jgi:hypothetical protein
MLRTTVWTLSIPTTPNDDRQRAQPNNRDNKNKSQPWLEEEERLDCRIRSDSATTTVSTGTEDTVSEELFQADLFTDDNDHDGQQCERHVYAYCKS